MGQIPLPALFLTVEQNGPFKTHFAVFCEFSATAGALLPQCYFLIFDILTDQAQDLIRKQGNNPKHQVQGYLTVPFDHDIVGAEVFF